MNCNISIRHDTSVMFSQIFCFIKTANALHLLLLVEYTKSAQSCTELEVIGLGGTTFDIGNSSRLQFCPSTGTSLKTLLMIHSTV